MFRNRSVFVSLFIVLILVLSPLFNIQPVFAACSGIVYVVPGGSGAGGCSWAAAFPNLQDALALAGNGDQIWVAGGTYYPDQGAGQTNDNRASTFNLKSGVSIYGGFAGTETQLSQRNVTANITVLSGDLDQVAGNTNNAYHVVTGTLVTSTAVLDGFTITGGNANGGDNYGGGMYLTSASPTLRNLNFNTNSGGNGGGLAGFDADASLTDVTFSNNSVSIHGGGVYLQDGSSMSLLRVSFTNNTSVAYGGGMAVFLSNPSLTDVTFDSNKTTGTTNPGGGMYNSDSAPVLNRVTFSNNRAENAGGGGMYNYASPVQLTNVTFYNNYANRRGGAIANETSSPVLNHVTMVGNSSTVQASGGMANFTNSDPVIRNSILWNDTPQEFVNTDTGADNPQIFDSIVQGGCPAGGVCTNVMTNDPALSGLANNGGFTQTMALGGSSPAVNAGNAGTCAATDQRGIARPQGGACDLGAYEYDGAFGPTSTFTPTSIVPTATFTNTPIITDTPAPPTATNTPVPPTATFTATLTPTNTFTATPTLTATITNTPSTCAGIIYVNANSSPVTQNGCTWSTAFPNLQDALALAGNGDQIWVAGGTYYPDQGAGQTNDNRASTFNLKSGVSIYGGFAGTETQLSQRNVTANITVLSGDLDQVAGNTNNAYHVVTGTLVTSTAVLDGFTITGGNANGGDNYGGGMYLTSASPTLRNLNFNTNSGGNGGGLAGFDADASLTDVTFSNNSVSIHGGGVYLQDGSSMSLLRVSFTNNTSVAYGGGMAVFLSNPSLTDVTFDSNKTTGTTNPGGGMYNSDSAPVLNRVTFSNNRAENAGGGGMYNYASPVQLTNVTFYNNYANRRGGAIANETSSPVLNHVTMVGNSSTVQASGGMANFTNSDPVIRNSILWNDTPQEFVNTDTGADNPQIFDSIVQGGCPAGGVCTNVMTNDPSLSGLANNGGFTQTMALGGSSPAVNAGNAGTCAATDQRGIARPQGGACDLGAYEYDGAFGPTPTFTPTNTFTPTFTATATVTDTPVPPTATFTATDTATFTPTSTFTFTPTYTATASNTPVPPTATFTATNTATYTPTSTFTFTPTNTATFTATATFTPTNTSTATFTPTRTPTNTATFTATNTPLPGASDTLYVSSTTDGVVGGVTFADEDILSYNRATGVWSMYFDGSDVGITSDVDAFTVMSNGTTLISVDTDGTITGFGTVDDLDILRFTPTSLGTNTAGAFTWYFDGSDVGLTTTTEDVDAIGFAPNGRLIVSTSGAYGVGTLAGNGEDLLSFAATTIGSSTSGSWSTYFDGSDVGLSNTVSEQINGIWIDLSTGKIYLTTSGAFSVTGVSGNGSDIFICTPGVLGATTTCTYSTYWQGTSAGFGSQDTDGIHIIKQ
ncbi:MAG: choice-of-anchor Q domain-containing protein [Anaerolineales bacterium]